LFAGNVAGGVWARLIEDFDYQAAQATLKTARKHISAELVAMATLV